MHVFVAIDMTGCIPLDDFARYLTVDLGRSNGTVEQYMIDLTLFLRYLSAKQNGIPTDGEGFASIPIDRIDYDFIGSITRGDLRDFLYFAATERTNSARTRARKLSALRSFYKYMAREKFVSENLAKDLDSPKIRQPLPKYLSLDESETLLETVEDSEAAKTRDRDFAIITLFLNCGMRLSELVGLNLADFTPGMKSVRVLGKGSKERIVYLNEACRQALSAYLPVRNSDPEIRPDSKDAMFISSRHKRISKKTVQWLVYRYLDEAGLESRHLSTHKLRHTAATLMYQTGKVDIRVLKDILGHEQLSTTQIYTHLSDDAMERALENNPLAKSGKKNR